MKGDLCLLNKAQIAHEILAYLAEHPEAQDTLDGILQWWLLERKIIYQSDIVKASIEELVRKGYLLRHTSAHARTEYRINEDRKEDIIKLTENGTP
jgi:hypothetical protein